MKYKLADFAQMIDHVNVKPNITKQSLQVLCEQAKNYNFKIVAINSVHTKYCFELLKDSNVGVGAAISFPYGQTDIYIKAEEALNAIKNGASEIDYTINLTEMLDHNYDYIKKEMKTIVDICKKYNVISKVIIETGFLSKEEIIEVCLIAIEVLPNFVKTSTGTIEFGATVENIKIMKEIVKDKVQIKASGGIRDAKKFIEMIKAGATRIGTSSGIKIMNELKEIMQENSCEYIEI